MPVACQDHLTAYSNSACLCCCYAQYIIDISLIPEGKLYLRVSFWMTQLAHIGDCRNLTTVVKHWLRPDTLQVHFCASPVRAMHVLLYKHEKAVAKFMWGGAPFAAR